MTLQSIRSLSWCVPDPEASAIAFERLLGHRRTVEGILSEAQARCWGAPAQTGAPVVEVEPEGGGPLLRWVQGDSHDDYAPLQTFGWNAAELHVADVRALQARLEDTDFEVIGPPRDLLGNGAVTAMQVMGPGQELLYLTQIDHPGMQKTYGRAETDVDRVFIVVLGVSDQARTLAHYAPMARFLTDPRPFPITVLARAHGMDPAQARFDIASVVMEQAYRIETDAYPASARPRPERPGRLPPGLAVVEVQVTGDEMDEPRLLLGPDRERLVLVSGTI